MQPSGHYLSCASVACAVAITGNACLPLWAQEVLPCETLEMRTASVAFWCDGELCKLCRSTSWSYLHSLHVEAQAVPSLDSCPLLTSYTCSPKPVGRCEGERYTLFLNFDQASFYFFRTAPFCFLNHPQT